MNSVDTELKYITIFNPEQIKYYINEEKLQIHRLDVNKNTNRAYVTFKKDDDTFRAYINWLNKCKEYSKEAQSK